MRTDNVTELEQGNIKALFPNLRMKVIANGCICEVIGVYEQQIKCEVVESFKSTYRTGIQFWVDSFSLID